jgi:hypothetical protein
VPLKRRKNIIVINRKMLICWGFASVMMFSLSYFWHGIILNDFEKINYPESIFLSFLALLYVILGFIISFGYSLFADKKNPFKSGSIIGVGSGFIIFLIVFVLGTSFTGRINSLYVTIDFLWQMIEQGLAGLLIAYVYQFIEKREMLFD